MNEWSPLEKAFTAMFAVIALLMFFFPLLVIQAPIVGEQDVSGYDIFSKVNQFRGQVHQSPAEPQSQPETPPSRNKQEPSPETPMPFSLKIAWLIPINVTAAFLLAAIAGIGTRVSVRASGTAALLGTVLAVGTILHISIANSDMHSWIQASLKTSSEDLKDNPFAAVAEQFGNLAACLLITTFIAKSRILTRLRVVAGPDVLTRGKEKMEGLKEEMFQLELELVQGHISQEEYQKMKAALAPRLGRNSSKLTFEEEYFPCTR